MSPFENVKKTLKKHKSILTRQFKVKKIGVFGSFVYNTQGASSDIDILVEFKEPVGFFHFLSLEEYLEKIFNRKIDLATKNALKPHMSKHILTDTVFI